MVYTQIIKSEINSSLNKLKPGRGVHRTAQKGVHTVARRGFVRRIMFINRLQSKSLYLCFKGGEKKTLWAYRNFVNTFVWLNANGTQVCTQGGFIGFRKTPSRRGN